MIEFFVDDVNRCAGDLRPLCDHRFMNMMSVHPLSAECRQQRRMHINNVISVLTDDDRINFFHVPGKNDKVSAMRFERRKNRLCECILRRKLLLAEMKCRDMKRLSKGQRTRVRIVADYNNNLC